MPRLRHESNGAHGPYFERIVVREAGHGDLAALWVSLAIATYEPSVETARRIPAVAVRLDQWKRDDDFGYIAEFDGSPIGAVWARQFSSAEMTGCFVDDRTPEITIGVVEQMRGVGIGTCLLRAVHDEALRRAVSLCLLSGSRNRAIHLYERMGYRRIDGREVVNRAGGTSIAMLLPHANAVRSPGAVDAERAAIMRHKCRY